MHCVNCGSKLEEDAIFCEKCGYKAKGAADSQTKTNINSATEAIKNFNYNSILSDLIIVLKNPLKAIKDASVLQNKNTNIILSIVTIVVTSFILVFGARMMISGVIKDAMSLGGLGSLGSFESTAIATQINETLGAFLPVFKTSLYIIIIFLLSFGLSIFGIYFVYKNILKKDIDIAIPIKILLISSLINSILSIIGILLASLSFTLAIIVVSLASAVNLAIIFLGFYSLSDSDDLGVYVLPVTYTVANLLTQYIAYKMLFNVILSLVSKARYF